MAKVSNFWLKRVQLAKQIKQIVCIDHALKQPFPSYIVGDKYSLP